MQDYVKIMDEMKEVRSRNNEIWMEITRLAMEHGGEEAKMIMARINNSDKEIGEVLKGISHVEKGVLPHLLFGRLETVRASNNHNWVSLLQLAYLRAETEVRDLLGKLEVNDGAVTELIEKLYKQEVSE